MKVRLLVADYVVPRSPVGSEHDVTEAEAALLFERGLAEPVKDRSTEPGESWTVKELQAHATAAGIDLGKAKSKADILAVINAPPKPAEKDGEEEEEVPVSGEAADGEDAGGEGDEPPTE